MPTLLSEGYFFMKKGGSLEISNFFAFPNSENQKKFFQVILEDLEGAGTINQPPVLNKILNALTIRVNTCH